MRLFPVKTVVESGDTDYRFRTFLDRDTVAGVNAAAIDYEHGFKDRTLDRVACRICIRCGMPFLRNRNQPLVLPLLVAAALAPQPAQ